MTQITKEDVEEVVVGALKEIIIPTLEDMHTDMQVLKKDVNTLKEDVSVLKEDVKILKQDVKSQDFSNNS